MNITPPTGSADAWTFYYDGQLNRYRIDKGTLGTRYLLWDGLNCLEERDASGTLVVRYSYGSTPIYGIGSCVEIFLAATSATYTLVMDHRGTASVLLDGTATAVGCRQYNAFGEIIQQTGTWPVDLGYQTNWQTVQIGTKWWGLSAARLYDFQTGRFTQRDRIKTFLVQTPSRGNRSTKQVPSNAWKTYTEQAAINSIARFSSIWTYLYSDHTILTDLDPSGLVCQVCSFSWGYEIPCIPPKAPRKPNGCGPDWVSSIGLQWLADNLSTASFTAACVAHDLCYDACHSNKSACDITLCIAMSSVCATLSGARQIYCMSIAMSYCLLVIKDGDAAWRRMSKIPVLLRMRSKSA